MLNNKVILVTGGTGSFGHFFVEYTLKNYNPKKIIIYSRDEYKQFLMSKKFENYKNKIRFFIGDIRDEGRLNLALNGVDYVIHACAMKQVTSCEYNPIEAIKTNIDGATNLINAVLNSNTVTKVIALSTDKAVNPINLYGATKLVSDKLFISANAYVGHRDLKFTIVRYGNVAGSRGSVIPLFSNIINSGSNKLPITDFEMTRFWISLEDGIKLIIEAIEKSNAGEIFVSKIPSFKITDLAKAMLPSCELDLVGIRPGEKLHESMITCEDSYFTYEYEKYFVIYPNFEWYNPQIIENGKKVPVGFSYNSNENENWLNIEQLSNLIKNMVFYEN